MSQSWYYLERELYEKLNAGRDRNSRYSYEQRVYMKTLIDHFKSNPEKFLPEMILDLNISAVAKINKILSYESSSKADDPARKENYIAIFNAAYKDLDVAKDKARPLYEVKGHSYATAFDSGDVNFYSSKGKKNYVSELKSILEDIALFKNQNWYKNVTAEMLFQDVKAENLFKSVGTKNFIVSLEKIFPHFKNDEKYETFKNDFFQAYYKKLKETKNNLFYHMPFSEIVSFLKDSYDEEALTILIKTAKDNPEYSYLKNKAAFDKIITVFPESKVVLNDYINAIKEDNIKDFFHDENYKLVSITIDFNAVEKTLLLDKVKSPARAICEEFLNILKEEKKLRKDNPMAWFFIDDKVSVSSSSYVSSLIFKVPLNDINLIGEKEIKNFIKKHFLNFVNVYPKHAKDNNYDIFWQEELINKDVANLPTATKISPPVKF